MHKLVDKAHAITYASGGSAIVIYGLQLGDIGVIVSMLGVVCGVAIQFYANIYRPWRDRRNR